MKVEYMERVFLAGTYSLTNGKISGIGRWGMGKGRLKPVIFSKGR